MGVPKLSIDELLAEGVRLNKLMDEPLPESDEETDTGCNFPVHIEDAMDEASDEERPVGKPIVAPWKKTAGIKNGVKPGKQNGAAPKAGPVEKARVQILPGRIHGRLQDWKGNYGWIIPEQPIDHPEARLHGGKIYISRRDFEGEIDVAGCRVEFFVYADGSGLGAMSCRECADDGPPVQKTIAKTGPAAKASMNAPSAVASGVVSGRPPMKALDKGNIDQQWAMCLEACGLPKDMSMAQACEMFGMPDNLSQSFGGSSNHRPATASASPAPWTTLGQQPQQWSSIGQQPGPAQWTNVGSTPSRANGAKPLKTAADMNNKSLRSRVSSMPINGTVLEWKGSYGWVEPSEPVKHPTFNGKLFLHKDDLLVKEEPVVGSSLVFLIYSDPNGLGAERALKASTTGAKDRVANGSSGMPRPTPPAPNLGAGSMSAQTAPSAPLAAATGQAAPDVAATTVPQVSHANPEIAKFLAAWMTSIGSETE